MLFNPILYISSAHYWLQKCFEKPEDLDKMGTKTLNERQAFGATRSHLEKVEILHGKAFSTSPINLGDSDESMEGDGDMEEKEGEGAEKDAISV